MALGIFRIASYHETLGQKRRNGNREHMIASRSRRSFSHRTRAPVIGNIPIRTRRHRHATRTGTKFASGRARLYGKRPEFSFVWSHHRPTLHGRRHGPKVVKIQTFGGHMAKALLFSTHYDRPSKILPRSQSRCQRRFLTPFVLAACLPQALSHAVAFLA